MRHQHDKGLTYSSQDDENERSLFDHIDRVLFPIFQNV